MLADPVVVLLFRYFWVMFIVVTTVNAAVWWHRAKPVIAAHPERRESYRRLVRGFLLWGNLPWIVMGAGMLFGGIPTIFHYFNPRNGPFVIAWYCTVVLLWLLSFIWLFFRSGAETLVDHPGLLNLPTSNPWVIKIFFLLCVLGGVIALTLMLFGDLQTPDFR